MANTSYTLLIWEEIPETTRLVLIPNEALSGEDRGVLRKTHGHLINASGTDDETLDLLNYILAALTVEAEDLDPAHPAGSYWAMRWTKYVQDNKKPILGVSITDVYHAGFLL